MIKKLMLQIQPESELNQLYSLNNSSGQLKWHMDKEFEEFCENEDPSEYNVWKHLASFFWANTMLFEFCLLVEGCSNHGLEYGYESYEHRVGKTLAKVRPPTTDN